LKKSFKIVDDDSKMSTSTTKSIFRLNDWSVTDRRYSKCIVVHTCPSHITDFRGSQWTMTQQLFWPRTHVRSHRRCMSSYMLVFERT